MRAASLLLAFTLACSSPEAGNAPHVSKEPISVRGWISDVETPPNAPFRTQETEAARRSQLFQSASVWVDNAPYISGGVIENGAFLLLDVPPGNITIELSAAGVPTTKLVLQNVPGNADVFLPGIILEPNGVGFVDPKAVQVRMAARIDKAEPANATATIAGLAVPVMNVPYAALTDRHEFPTPPATSFKPLAVVH